MSLMSARENGIRQRLNHKIALEMWTEGNEGVGKLWK